MTLSRKLLYAAATLLLVAGPAIETVSQLTNGIVVKAEEKLNFSKPPEKTVIKIHKLQGTNFSDVKESGGIKNINGEVVQLEELSKQLGTNVTGLAGVTFKYYKITSQGMKTYPSTEELKTVSTVSLAKAAVDKGDLIYSGETSPTERGTGLTTVSLESTDSAKYLFIEDKKPKNISSSLGLPFVIDLPISDLNGRDYLKEINVYPKNTVGDEPKVDKDVTELGNDDDSYQVGDTIDWYLKSTIPQNITDYTVFKLSDALEKSLSFIDNSEEKSIDNVFVGGEKLIKNNDYIISLDGTKKILDISLTEKGIQKIATLVKKGIIKNLVLEDQDLYKAKSNTNDNAFLSVKISAKINENAVMAKRIKNNFTLSFSNNPNKITKKKTVPPFELPEVHTGGKRFKKVNDVNRIPLSGAEFALFQDDMLKDQINWTEDLIKMNQSAIKDGKFAGEIVKGQPIILKSNIQGEFEIKGLQYGSKGSKLRSESIEDTKERSGKTTYYLREIVAPSGYVISQKTIVFDVTFDSYYKDPTQVDLGMIEGTATPLEIKNTKRPSIPNTGGIGTAIFIVIGAAVMAFAAKGMKRRSDENE